MTDENDTQNEDITAPPEETKDATTPPGNPETDEEALEEGKDRLEQAGGGH